MAKEGLAGSAITGSGTLRPARASHQIGPIPVIILIGLQVMAIGALLATAEAPGWRACGAAMITLGAWICLRRGGEHLISPALRALRRPRRLGPDRARASSSSPSSFTSGTGSGLGSGSGSGLSSPRSSEPQDYSGTTIRQGEIAGVGDSSGDPQRASIEAVYPGLQVRGARDRRGQAFVMWHWSGVTTVAMTLTGAELIAVGEAGANWLPLDEILARLQSSGLPVESMAVVSVLGATAVPPAPTLAIRLRTALDPAAEKIRGGAQDGVAACAAAALGHAEAALRAVGIKATPMTQAAAYEGLWASMEVIAGSDPHAAPVHDRHAVSLHATRHTTYVATSMSATADLEALWLAPEPLRVVCLEVAPLVARAPAQSASMAPRVGIRSLVRRLDGAPDSPADRTDHLTDLAPGLRWRRASDQLAGLRASSLLGDGLPIPRDLALPPSGPPLRRWMIAPRERIGALVPTIGSRATLGKDPRGAAITLNLLSRRASRILAIGDPQPVMTLLSHALRAGMPGVVISPDPERWTTLADQWGARDRVLVVSAEHQLPGTAPPGPMMIVLDGPGILSNDLARVAWRVQVQYLESSSQLTRALPDGADAVILGHGVPTQELAGIAESLRLHRDQLVESLAQPGQLLLVAGERVMSLSPMQPSVAALG